MGKLPCKHPQTIHSKVQTVYISQIQPLLEKIETLGNMVLREICDLIILIYSFFLGMIS